MSELLIRRLSSSAAVKERRLAALLDGRDPKEPTLLGAIEDAQVLGSLQLAGFDFTWEAVTADRAGASPPSPVSDLKRAMRAVDSRAPVGLSALLVWHGSATGGPGRLRTEERPRADGPPPAPAEFIEGRLAILEQWLGAESSRDLKPHQLGALVMARIVEILPFDDGNGRVARLAASHLMVRAGARPPILVGGDGPRLRQALDAAFQLVTEPLGALLDEASERCLDVLIQTLASRRPA